MHELIMPLTFLIIVYGTVRTLFSYTIEGDISTFTFGTPSADVMRQKYLSKQSVVDRLRDLLVYRESYVKWPKQMILAAMAAFVVLSYCKGLDELRAVEWMVLTAFLFLIIDLPSRWGHAHISRGLVQEAQQLNMLYGMLP